MIFIILFFMFFFSFLISNLICVGADYKIDNNTLIMSENMQAGVSVMKRSTGKENYMVVTAESEAASRENLN